MNSNVFKSTTFFYLFYSENVFALGYFFLKNLHDCKVAELLTKSGVSRTETSGKHKAGHKLEKPIETTKKVASDML